MWRIPAYAVPLQELQFQSKGEGKEGADPKTTLIWTLYYKLQLKLKHTDRDTEQKE
jgi:hypothetical protein